MSIQAPSSAPLKAYDGKHFISQIEIFNALEHQLLTQEDGPFCNPLYRACGYHSIIEKLLRPEAGMDLESAQKFYDQASTRLVWTSQGVNSQTEAECDEQAEFALRDIEKATTRLAFSKFMEEYWAKRLEEECPYISPYIGRRQTDITRSIAFASSTF